MPYASLQVDWPGWLLESWGAGLVVLPAEECLVFCFCFFSPPWIAQARVLQRPTLFIWALGSSLPSTELVSLGDGAEVFSVMLRDEDLPLPLLLQGPGGLAAWLELDGQILPHWGAGWEGESTPYWGA